MAAEEVSLDDENLNTTADDFACGRVRLMANQT